MASIFPLEKISLRYHPGESGKRPLVFVHGNTQNDTCGKGLMQFFSKRGHPVLSYDLPGHGGSPLSRKDYQFDQLVVLNQALINKFQLQHPILAGHSLGGMIQAATIAKDMMATSSLILCGSLDCNPVNAASRIGLDQSHGDIKALLADYIACGYENFVAQEKFDYFAHREMDDEQVDQMNLQVTDPEANAANLSGLGDFDARASLTDLSTPVLVLHGEAETVIPAPLVKEMASHYDSMHCCWYPDGGHYAFYQHPKMTDQFLSDHYQLINN